MSLRSSLRARISGWSPTRRRAVAVVTAAVLLGLIVALAAISDSKSDRLSVDNGTSTTSRGLGGSPGAASTASSGGDAGAGTTTSGPSTTLQLGGQNAPVDVNVSNNTNLTDGAPVAIHVAPKDGSAIFGFEAWICKGGVDYIDDADVRPSQTGNCAAHALSGASDHYIGVRSAPPYGAADGSFRAGVGTDTYKMQDGTPVTISCGPGQPPCVIVLKLQYPNGFGFKAIPLSYR